MASSSELHWVFNTTSTKYHHTTPCIVGMICKPLGWQLFKSVWAKAWKIVDLKSMILGSSRHTRNPYRVPSWTFGSFDWWTSWWTCRIPLFPTVILKLKWLGSEVQTLKYPYTWGPRVKSFLIWKTDLLFYIKWRKILLHSPLIISFNQFQKRAIKTKSRTFTFIQSIQPQINLLYDSEH